MCGAYYRSPDYLTNTTRLAVAIDKELSFFSYFRSFRRKASRGKRWAYNLRQQLEYHLHIFFSVATFFTFYFYTTASFLFFFFLFNCRARTLVKLRGFFDHCEFLSSFLFFHFTTLRSIFST